LKAALLSYDFICGNLKHPEINKTLCDFVSIRVWGKTDQFGPCGSLGIIKKGVVIAVVVFHNWQPDDGTIELSAAADDPRWLTRTVIRQIMSICFEQHGCQQVFTRQAVDNERAIKIYRYMKFTEILLPNMRGKGKDEILMLLTKDEWDSHFMNEAKP
jgi:RimJ/RimL family protein N-acetyltransferase